MMESENLSLGEELYNLDSELSQSRRLKYSYILYPPEKSSSVRFFTFAKLLLVFLLVLVGVLGLDYSGLFSGQFSFDNILTGNNILSDNSILPDENSLSDVSEIKTIDTGAKLNLGSELFLVIPFVIITVLSLYNLNTYLDIKSKLKNRIKIN